MVRRTSHVEGAANRTYSAHSDSGESAHRAGDDEDDQLEAERADAEAARPLFVGAEGAQAAPDP